MVLLAFFPQATSSARYLLDFCHIPDKSLIIDELQQLLQLAQICDKAFPNFLQQQTRNVMRHFAQSTPSPAEVPQSHWELEETVWAGKGAQFLIVKLLCVSKKPSGNRALAKIQTSPPLSRSFSRKREDVCTCATHSWQLEKVMGRIPRHI